MSTQTYKKITEYWFMPLSSVQGQRKIRPVVILGSLLFALLYFITLQKNAQYIENDLSAASMVNVTNPNVDVSFDGRDAVVSGIVASSQEAAEIVRSIRNVLGVRTVDNQLNIRKVIAVAPKVSPKSVPESSPAPDMSAKLAKTGQLSFDNIRFETGSANILSEAYSTLNEGVTAMMSLGDSARFIISGHTDNTGSAALNKSLSLKRAQAVKRYFVSKGVAASNLKAEGYGSSQPVADNSSSEGRQKNRRIEISQVK